MDKMEVPNARHVVFTIVAQNYLAKALVLGRSFRETNPEIKFYIVLADVRRLEFEPLSQRFLSDDRDFGYICIDDIPYPRIFQMAIRYNPIEFCTAIKPSVFLMIKDKYSGAIISYFDPDIVCYSPVVEMEKGLCEHSILVTPHMLSPLEDNRNPSLSQILAVGVYNFGYFGVNAASAEVEPLLKWWQLRLDTESFSDTQNVMFYDQIWGNIFPCFVDSTKVLRHPGYNVAYWNLHERMVAKSGGGFTINGLPLRFFHFSGYDPRDRNNISKHQDRFRMEAMPVLQELFDDYAHRLSLANDSVLSQIPYSWSTSGNLQINARVRKWFHHLGSGVNSYGQEPLKDPRFRQAALRVSRGGSFLTAFARHTLNQQLRPLLQRLPKSIQDILHMEENSLRLLMSSLKGFMRTQVTVFKKVTSRLKQTIQYQLRG
jgi:hypothetical protein